MNRVFLLLGSNIDKELNINAAVKLLRRTSNVTALSTVYETKPVGLLNQPNFLNMAVLLETDLDPAQIKERIIEPIERTLDRRRLEDKNAPRTIDLDIVLYNGDVLDYMHGDAVQRHLPDPDLVRFAHVAAPIAELAPQMLHPETGQPLAEIAGALIAAEREPVIWKRLDLQP